MKESFKKLSKEYGLENAEMTAHLYLYMKYIDHYVSKIGGRLGLTGKPPFQEIPPDVDEVIELYARKVMKDSLSAETSSYHAKVMPLEHASDLLMVNEEVDLRGLEHVIPFKVANDIVLREPLRIAVFDCACRLLQENPCQPVNVCMAVGEPVASFVLEAERFRAREVGREEAVEILRAEHERGHVHSAYFKDAAAGRFYAICNCCPCCCVGMQAFNKFRSPMLASSGYVAEVSGECDGCGECSEICPFNAVELEETAVVDPVACMGCGVCEGVCEPGAIRLVEDPTRSRPLDIRRLIAEKSGK